MGRTPESTHRIMSSLKSKNTTPERLLCGALWARGMRFRKNYDKLPGKPDIVFTKVKLAIFCDGDFWHGNNWRIRGLSSFEDELAGYSEYWKNKITTNIERDNIVNDRLKNQGWTVIRFWESDIRKNVEVCAELIILTYREKLSVQQNIHK